MPVDEMQADFDRDSHDVGSANQTAAGMVRRLAAQLEQASYTARTVRVSCEDAEERAKRLDFALVHLASVMSDVELISLVNALRHTADVSQDEHFCEFCGRPTEPWSMLTCDPSLSDEDGEDDSCEVLIHHSWDQYGVTLCKSCHLSVRQARWQAASQM